MLITYSYNKKINEQYYTQWIIFKVNSVNYTKSVIEKVRNYLAQNVNPAFAEAKDESIKGWHTGKYDDECLTYDAEFKRWDITYKNGFSSIPENRLIFVDL